MTKEYSVLLDIDGIHTHILEYTNAMFSKLNIPLITNKKALEWAREYTVEALQGYTVPGRHSHGNDYFRTYLCDSFPVFNAQLTSKGKIKEEPRSLYDEWENFVLVPLEDSPETHFLRALKIPFSIEYNYLSFEHAGAHTLMYIGADIRHVLFNQMVADKTAKIAVQEISERYRSELLEYKESTETIILDLDVVRSIVPARVIESELSRARNIELSTCPEKPELTARELLDSTLDSIDASHDKKIRQGFKLYRVRR